MTDVKLLIVGRAGVGKSSIASHLESEGVSRIRSYTTALTADENASDYIHIDNDEAKDLLDRAIAKTSRGNAIYFTTIDEFMSNDMLVVDVPGAISLVKSHPDTAFLIANITMAPAFREPRMLAKQSEFLTREALAQMDKEASADFDKFEYDFARDASAIPAFDADNIICTHDEIEPKDPIWEVSHRIAERWRTLKNVVCMLDTCPTPHISVKGMYEALRSPKNLCDQVVGKFMGRNLIPAPKQTRIEQIEALMPENIFGKADYDVVLASVRKGTDASWRTVTVENVAGAVEVESALATYLKRAHLPIDTPVESITVAR